MVDPDALQISAEMSRTGSAKAFEERLRSSIDEIGLAEPLKVARHPDGGYVVIDGAMRLRAVRAIRKRSPDRFSEVAVYLLEYAQRFEVRFQSDIYQDLLPSQMATLVEHLHRSENVRKTEIARFIGVSPATLRNYTGLWRLMERGNLFATVVALMDLGVVPSSNPYAWLRLTESGLRRVLSESFARDVPLNEWVASTTAAARRSESVARFPIKFVETVTDSLPPEFYRVTSDVRAVKRDLGLRKARGKTVGAPERTMALANLTKVSRDSPDVVLRMAASSLMDFLR